ncbi:MAG: hypothetical protein CL912_24580 [Deltaproteobacteria bacterium]|nr:hypothetical protein [Deltaproteobacteria bacterium]|tara:strand:- start:403 stop:702 length:300 start_codon:yes stop_codon:yes gene_type:complete
MIFEPAGLVAAYDEIPGKGPRYPIALEMLMIEASSYCPTSGRSSGNGRSLFHSIIAHNRNVVDNTWSAGLAKGEVCRAHMLTFSIAEHVLSRISWWCQG